MFLVPQGLDVVEYGSTCSGRELLHLAELTHEALVLRLAPRRNFPDAEKLIHGYGDRLR
jgi:hypothetical protein